MTGTGAKANSGGDKAFMKAGRGWWSDNRAAKRLVRDQRNVRSRVIGKQEAQER